MAHEFSCPEAGICQNSAVHCGLMCFIHLPSAFSHRSTPLMRVHACACEQTRLYVMPCPTMSRLQPVCVSSHAKTIFFLINHANNTKQLCSESSCEA